MIKPIISFCIPTFNRIEVLKISLSPLLPLLKKYNIEICISDNASIDGTVNYLHEIKLEYPSLKYYQQIHNVGIDLNMRKVISMATAGYIFPLGDDDVFMPNRIGFLIDEIKHNRDLIIINGVSSNKETLKNNLQDVEFFSLQKAYSKLWDKMPFGSFLFKKELYNTAYYDLFLDTSHAYSGVIWKSLDYLEKECGSINVVCLSEVMVSHQDVPKTWNASALKIYFEEIPLWLIRCNFHIESFKSLNILESYLERISSYRQLIVFKRRGILTKTNWHDISSNFSHQQLSRIKLTSLIPVFVSRLIVDAYDFIKR